MLDLLAWNQPGLEDLLVVVDVMQKAIEGRHTLLEAAFHAAPFVGRNDAWDQIKRNQALGASAVLVFFTVHRKGDTDTAKNHFGFFAPFGHHVAGLTRQPLVVNLVMVTNLGPMREELIGQLGVHLVKFLHHFLLLNTA